MESSQESEEIRTENPVSSSAIEPLLNLALGASEEVNTTSNSKVNTGKTSYSLRSKTTNANDKPTKDLTEEFAHNTPLNSPIVSCSTSQSQTTAVDVQTNVNDLVRVVSANEVDMNPVFNAENLHLVSMQGDNSLSNEGSENPEATPIPGGFVVIEQSVLEQISGFLKNAVAMQSNNVSKVANQVTATTNVTTSLQEQQEEQLPNSTTNCARQSDTKAAACTPNQAMIPNEEDEWIDTKATALQLTDELRRYHIPQAVFARKVLNRSQGTLSDILRKPKPWNEMRLGKEIFRKMKEWLSLPEVKRIPQLRTEAAKELDSRHKRQIDDTYDESNSTPKKIRRQFTEAQKRTLFAIFKETQKPTKDMQRALAEELGLDLTTVSNFFMNARRRHTKE